MALTFNEVLEVGTPVVASTVVGLAYDLLEEKIILHSLIVASKVATIKYSGKQYYMKNCLNRAATFGIKNMAETFMTSIVQLTEQRCLYENRCFYF